MSEAKEELKVCKASLAELSDGHASDMLIARICYLEDYITRQSNKALATHKENT